MSIDSSFLRFESQYSLFFKYLDIKPLDTQPKTHKKLHKTTKPNISKRCQICYTEIVLTKDLEPQLRDNLLQFGIKVLPSNDSRISSCLSGYLLPDIYLKKSSNTQTATIPSLSQETQPIKPLFIIEGLFHAPIAVMRLYYDKAQIPDQRRICLSYLLHTQHYNAEFTERECKALGYSTPIFAPQTKHGYIRTEYHRLFELATPWIKEYIDPHFKSSFGGRTALPLNSNDIPFVQLSVRSTKLILKFFFREQLRDIGTLSQTRSQTIIFVFIDIKLSDLEEDAYEIVKKRVENLAQIRQDHPKLHFIFTLEQPNIDCSLMWGATWHKNPNVEKLYCLKLHKIFSRPLNAPSVYSILNESGAVSDRLALNQFLTAQLEAQDFEADLKKLKPASEPAGISLTDLQYTWSPNTSAIWQRQMEDLRKLTLENDPGSDLYRRAILQWHSCFFENYCFVKENKFIHFAAPLLCSQVSPWILIPNHKQLPQITQWAKAYQNLCEVVMFCLQAFPDQFKEFTLENLQDSLLGSLQGGEKFLTNIHTSFGLFPYAMSAFWHIFDHLLGRFKDRPFSMTCVCQNYFETIGLVDLIETKKAHNVTIHRPKLLDDVLISEVSDVLIADIHPNNASLDFLAQNNIAMWVKNALEANSSKNLVLILDITLNNLSDFIIRKTFSELATFIANGRLEIFCIQSLAKLVQIGADNFSGGACFYFGNQATKAALNFPAPISEKVRFLALMQRHFQSLIANYFQQIRQNTDLMYTHLTSNFENIFSYGYDRNNRFCAAKIAINGDYNTVYVAINFNQLLTCLKIGENTKTTKKKLEAIDRFIKGTRNLMLALARSRGLPITARQSFGFSLSNMSPVVEAIRFSLGVENNQLMQRYAELVTDFIRILSIYVKKKPNLERNSFLKAFKKDVYKIMNIFENGNAPNPLFSVSWQEETLDKELGHVLIEVGSAKLEFKESRLILSLKKNDGTESTLINPAIKLYRFHNYFDVSSESNMTDLFFHTICLGRLPSCITLEKLSPETMLLVIHGIMEDLPLHLINDKVTNEEGIRLSFGNERTCTFPDGTKLPNDKIFMNIPELNMGNSLVSFNRIRGLNFKKLFNLCVQHPFTLTPSPETGKGTYQLHLGKAKPTLDYLETLKTLTLNKSFSDAIDFINNALYPKPLWIPTDFNYKYQQRPEDGLIEVLKHFGSWIRKALTPEIGNLIGTLETDRKKAVLKGAFEDLLSDSLNNRDLTIENTAGYKELIEKEGIPVDDELFEFWIKNLEKYLKKKENDSPQTIASLIPYLTIFLPAFKKISLLDTTHSIALRFIAEKTNFKDLCDHLTDLENTLLNANNLSDHAYITAYMRYYADYLRREPEKATLLQALSRLPSMCLNAWIQEPGFYFDPMDRENIEFAEPPYDYIVFGEVDSAKLKAFFTGIKAKEILLNGLKQGNNLETGLLWAIRTQDDDLFNALSEQVLKLSSAEEVKNMAIYQCYLKESNPSQKQLKSLLKDRIRSV